MNFGKQHLHPGAQFRRCSESLAFLSWHFRARAARLRQADGDRLLAVLVLALLQMMHFRAHFLLRFRAIFAVAARPGALAACRSPRTTGGGSGTAAAVRCRRPAAARTRTAAARSPSASAPFCRRPTSASAPLCRRRSRRCRPARTRTCRSRPLARRAPRTGPVAG